MKAAPLFVIPQRDLNWEVILSRGLKDDHCTYNHCYIPQPHEDEMICQTYDFGAVSIYIKGSDQGSRHRLVSRISPEGSCITENSLTCTSMRLRICGDLVQNPAKLNCTRAQIISLSLQMPIIEVYSFPPSVFVLRPSLSVVWHKWHFSGPREQNLIHNIRSDAFSY